MKLTWRACGKLGCPTPHKSPSGYCAEHAHLVDQLFTARPVGSTVTGRARDTDRLRRKPKYGLGG